MVCLPRVLVRARAGNGSTRNELECLAFPHDQLGSRGNRTGRQLAVEMSQKFRGRDWIAVLALESGASRDAVEWHLQEDMVPSKAKEAALNMLASAEGSAEQETSHHRCGSEPQDNLRRERD